MPSVTIGEINDKGRFDLIFSEDMYVQPDLSLLREGKATDFSGVTRPIFDVRVRIGEDSPNEKLGYSMEVVLMSPRTLVIQLNFENPSYVSMADEAEVLEIQINGGQIFYSTEAVYLGLPEVQET